MKIYTKTGDNGSTSLIGGTRVLKNHFQIEAYGSVDELNAHVGMVIALNNNDDIKTFLIKIQHDLFIIGSQLALSEGKKKVHELPELKISSIEDVEKTIDEYDKQLPALKNFILPNGNQLIAAIHIARCVCRRAERNVVGLVEQKITVPAEIIIYLNRLSDYFFILARHIALINNIQETIWKK